MDRFASFMGKRVQVHYRTADMNLSAAGILVSDNGKSLFLEEKFSQSGRNKTMRVEIPHECVIRLALAPADESATQSGPSSPSKRS
ncbi:MAG TPA: hypothetical protein VIC00_06645 [Candidatus Acidoferrales bacterium]|jgi:hypothetical protein